MESIDDLLADLKAEYTTVTQSSAPASARANPVKTVAKKSFNPDQQNQSLLSQIKAEYEEVERIETLKKQEEQKQNEIRQQQLLIKQKEALKKTAQEWLKQLQPLSEEGLWFEEFAYKYPSKLEAAIDYLQAVGTGKS